MGVSETPEFLEGYQAHNRGRTEDENPYWPSVPGNPNYDKGRSWQLGWMEAWLDD